jgi:putative transposase
VATWSGLVDVAFVIDACGRMLVGWQASRSRRTDLALDALEMAIGRRHGGLDGLVQHSDRAAKTSPPRHRAVGRGRGGHLGGLPRGLLRPRAGRDDRGRVQDRTDPPARPWKGIDQVEYATLEWVDWFNHRRLLEPIGHVPPAELEAASWRREAPGSIEGLKQPSLR